ncbi:Dual specificity protein kinase YAK1 [Cyberlindnera fabianii]|uniref:Dual specificity protein kinase YAK1 n=1 Tax=Cyberlindnera fabianii TaxID=36022 RepID=A0A1V2L4J1_CYBFA|nr:Dual specificity protein kinase YAK1 [Cyberlindnera fabianii]
MSRSLKHSTLIVQVNFTDLTRLSWDTDDSTSIDCISRKIVLDCPSSQVYLRNDQLVKDALPLLGWVHLLRGLLNLSPLERWTPHQAILHPFVTEQHFTGDWNPPGTGIRKAHGGGEYHDLKKSAQGNQWFK